MTNLKGVKAIYTLAVLLFAMSNAYSCSMYKISVGNKTIVGTNFDAFYTSPRIWFENANGASTYGAAFSGGRISGANGYAPQSGMNEAGLSFSRLAAPTPEKNTVDMHSRKPIPNECSYLKEIMHTCKSIEEVQNYISEYDHSFFLQDVFIYIEKSGKYLIVEPYTLTTGNDANYVLSNFCPSVTNAACANKLARYRKGVELLKTRVDTSMEFCRALSDTMHVCRKKIGDGTLLSTNWDLREGTMTLYFYHDFKHAVRYNLKDELSRGDHFLSIPDLFPPNPEFERLLAYKIPQNTTLLAWFIAFSGVLFFFTSLTFSINIFMKRKTADNMRVQIFFAAFSIIMTFYMYSLLTHIGIFYDPAPYKDYIFTIQNIVAYVPFVLLLLLVPFIVINGRVIKNKNWPSLLALLLSINNLTFIILVCLFFYWGLYGI